MQIETVYKYYFVQVWNIYSDFYTKSANYTDFSQFPFIILVHVDFVT